MGDFNCRQDNGSPMGASLVELMSFQNLILCNSPSKATYFGPKGSSTIDLMFVDNDCFNLNSVSFPKFHSANLGKYVPVQFDIQFKQDPPQSQYDNVIPSKLKNDLNLNVIMDIANSNRQYIKECFENENVDDLSGMFKFLIHNSASQKKVNKRQAKPFFDKQCYLLKKKVLAIFHALK